MQAIDSLLNFIKSVVSTVIGWIDSFVSGNRTAVIVVVVLMILSKFTKFNLKIK